VKRLLLSIFSAGVLAVSANAARTVAAEEPQKDGDYYLIGTVGQLYGFYNKVVGGELTANARLTQDITVNNDVVDPVTGKLNSGHGYAGIDSLAGWDGNKILNYAGTFDGNGHVISGLGAYCYGETQNCALFGSVAEGAVIKNLTLKDGYIKSHRAAGLVYEVAANGGSAIIDGCSVSATVLATPWEGGTNPEYVGGFVGKVSSGTLVISNSTVSSRLVAASASSDDTSVLEVETPVAGSKMGAFVGGVVSGATAKIYSSYNLGTSIVTTGSSDIGAFMGSRSATDSVVYSFCSAGASSCANGKDLSKLEAAKNSVTFHFDNSNKLIATVHDKIMEFVVVEDVKVDGVVFDRSFNANVSSTVSFPFDFTTSIIGNATLYDVESINRDDNDQFVSVTASPLSSNTSYGAYRAFMIVVDGTNLKVNGGVTLKSNYDANRAEWKNFEGNAWHFIRLTARKRWEKADGTNPENVCEIGRVYGFSASNTFSASGDTIHAGDFVKVVNKVAISPLRAYLGYGYDDPCTNDPTARSISSISLKKISQDPTESLVAVDSLPERLKVIFLGSEESSDDKISENPNDPENETTSFGGAVLQGTTKSDRWYDFNGRILKDKPKSQGAFLKNSVPVIVR